MYNALVVSKVNALTMTPPITLLTETTIKNEIFIIKPVTIESHLIKE